MYVFKNIKKEILKYPQGKIYKELNTTYFMLIDKNNCSIFARELLKEDMERENKLYPEGYISFNEKTYPVIIISNSLKTFEEAETAIASYKKGFEELEKIIKQFPKEELEDETTIPKTFVYDYLFNYFGGEKYKDKIIGGACIELAIRVYKDGQEIKFLKEEEASYHIPNTNKHYYLSDVFDVSYNRDNEFVVQKNINAEQIMRLTLPCDKIEYEIIGYAFDCFESKYCVTPINVSELEFRAFLKLHANDFDISDNKHAQVPSYGMI